MTYQASQTHRIDKQRRAQRLRDRSLHGLRAVIRIRHAADEQSDQQPDRAQDTERQSYDTSIHQEN